MDGALFLWMHGAISPHCGGNTGLLAGCGLVVHILRAFLQPPRFDLSTNVRIYVDDVTLATTAKTAWGVVRALGFALLALKAYPTS